MAKYIGLTIAALAGLGFLSQAQAEELCQGFGPQTPRDISQTAGLNTSSVSIAPSADKLNLCNIHTHTNAEHKGPGFTVFAGDGDHGGYKCNGTADLTEAELAEPAGSAFHGVKPGDTIGNFTIRSDPRPSDCGWLYTALQKGLERE